MSAKQDRQGVRTPANLEQKYSFGKVFDSQARENARQNEEMNQQNLTMKQFISFAASAIETLQKDMTAANKTIQELSDSNKSLQSNLTKYWQTVYPVGSIYVSVSAISPATLFGGTWERIQDRFLLAAGSAYAAGTTGGEATHTLTIDEMPSHTHNLSYGINANHPGMAITAMADSAPYASPVNSSTGGSQPHNNMPPYIVVYVWKRTA